MKSLKQKIMEAEAKHGELAQRFQSIALRKKTFEDQLEVLNHRQSVVKDKMDTINAELAQMYEKQKEYDKLTEVA
jgi:chromosome segregation ATPase